MALTEKEIQEIQQKTTFQIFTKEAEQEVLSRTMWKPKPIRIPKRTVTSAAYQQVLVRAYLIVSNMAKGEQEDMKQRLTYHYKIYNQWLEVYKAERKVCYGLRLKSVEHEKQVAAAELRDDEIQKTNKLRPSIMKSIPQSMFDLVLDNWHLITSRNFKINM